MVRIGIAMLQGARHEHCEAMQHAALEMNVTVEIVELRTVSYTHLTLPTIVGV